MQHLTNIFHAASEHTTHVPQLHDYLTCKLKFQFRENGMDITIKPLIKKVIGLRFGFKY